jgi:hypothetical protein
MPRVKVDGTEIEVPREARICERRARTLEAAE